MLSKPVAAGLVVAGVLVAAFAGGYVAQQAKADKNEPDILGVEGLSPEDPKPNANAAAGGGGGAAAAGGGGAGGGQAAAGAGGGGGGGPKRIPPLRPSGGGGGGVATAGGGGAPAAPNAPANPPAGSGAANPAGGGAPASNEPEMKELVVPAGTAIGLVLTKDVSSAVAKVEDPVEARILQDVNSGAMLAFPGGAKIMGSITKVDKGGKIKEPAKLGIKFHTVILNDGQEIKVEIDPLMFEASPGPAQQSTKKIGAGVAAGAALGWILGGKSGAIKGGAIGAGGGTALNQLTNESIALLPAGSRTTVLLQQPTTVIVTLRK